LTPLQVAADEKGDASPHKVPGVIVDVWAPTSRCEATTRASIAIPIAMPVAVLTFRSDDMNGFS
jgi:hypothetical protein